MAGCALDAAREKQEQQENHGQRPLIESLRPTAAAVQPAEQNSEPQRLAEYAHRWVGSNPLPNDPPNRAWTNLRSIQTIMAGEGFHFREGFPTAGPVSTESMARILTGATKGNERIVPVTDGTLREGDIVGSALPQSRIGVDTCGLRASLGIVQRDGTVAKFNSDKAQIVAATQFFQQSDVRVYRVVH